MIRPSLAKIIILLVCFASFPAKSMTHEELQSVGLSFFADEQDARLLLDWLNADPNIAFIIHDGPRWYDVAGPPPNAQSVMTIGSGHPEYRQRWRAVRHVDQFEETDLGDYTLWHVPSGPRLPMVKARQWEPKVTVPDPWTGWVEEQPNEMQDTPYFGSYFNAIIHLRLLTRHQAYTEAELKTLHAHVSYWLDGDVLAESYIHWTPPSANTQQWWRRFEDWISQVAVKLQDTNGDVVFWAFPSALKRLKGGLSYKARGFNLDASIKRAKNPKPSITGHEPPQSK